jgi:tRNA (guanine6-N2)-methyltransferase
MNKYFATFPAGFEKIIAAILLEKIDAKINESESGFIIFSTKVSSDEVKRLPIFSNVFTLLAKDDLLDIEEFAEILLKKSFVNNDIDAENETFRIMVSDENQTISLQNTIQRALEDHLASSFRLRVDRSLPDTEFWIIKRASGILVFGQRITKRSSDNYEKGELKDEIVYMMNYLADPNQNDIVIDPFAGSGALMLSRAKYFPYGKIFVADKERSLMNKLPPRFTSYSNVFIKKMDATNMSEIKSHSINKIVTDPPWGIFENITNVTEFYKEMLQEFERVTTKNAKIVILTAAKQELRDSLAKYSQFEIQESFNVLVSGKKCEIFIINKK